MMIIGGVMLMMMTTMTIIIVTFIISGMAVVLLVPLLFLNMQVCVSKFNLFACLITAFPKKSKMELIIHYENLVRGLIFRK